MSFGFHRFVRALWWTAIDGRLLVSIRRFQENRTTVLRSRLAIVAVGLLTGCARFQSQPLSPAHTADQLESRSLTNAALKSFLETNLHRPFPAWPVTTWEFDTLTLVAFYYHPSLDVARADWHVAAGGVETASERPNPTVSWSLLHEPVPAASPWIPGLVFDIPVETAGKRRYRTEQARHLTDSARFNIATAAWQVRSQLRASLLDLSAAHQRLLLVQHQAGLREQLLHRLESQLEAGAISAAELNTARLALLRAQADLADAERVLAEIRPRLAAALGLPVAALTDVEFLFDLAIPPAAAELSTSEARRLALLGRADVLGALADYAAAQSALQLEIAKQYPDVHLSPGYSWNAGSAGENDWQIGATVEVPLLSHHQGAVAEASARREAGAARFLALQAKVMSDIDGALASFHAGETSFSTLNALAATQAAQQKSVVAQLGAGAVDRTDVLAAELELDAANLARLDAQVKLQQALGALEDAVQRPFELPAAIYESRRSDAR
jgi:cobalt-zinc-cadmium efflux system outer membrane protein